MADEEDEVQSASRERAPKKKRPKGIDEPPLGLGRDIELDVRAALGRWMRGAIITLGIGGAFVPFGMAMLDDDPRGGLVAFGGGLLIVIGLWMLAVLVRNRSRTDLVARFGHRRLDIPRLALFGPTRIECGYEELAGLALMQSRSGMWIELVPMHGPKAIVPMEWVQPVAPIMELYWRLELRRTVARTHRGKAPRAAIVGAEAQVALGSPEHPIAGVVLSRTESKRPVVIAAVASVPEFFQRLREWPDDAKLYVPSDVHAAMMAALDDPSRLL